MIYPEANYSLKTICRYLLIMKSIHNLDDIAFSSIHPKIKNKSFYYLPIRDRIVSLLQSDIKNLLFYIDFMSNVDDNNVMLIQCHFYINKCHIYINKCHFYVKIMSKNVWSIKFGDLLIF
jgi:hypothetical protein